MLKGASDEDARRYRFGAVFIDAVLKSGRDLDLDAALERKSAGLPLLHYVWPTTRYALSLLLTGRSLRRFGPPLIIDAHDVLSAYLAGRLFPKTRQVLTIHTIGGWVSAGFIQLRPHLRGTWVERFFRYVEKAAVRRANAVVFPSRGAAELFELAYPGILAGKDMQVINPGLDVTAIDQVPADRTPIEPYGIGDRHLILCVAAHVREKGLDVLLNAVAGLPKKMRGGIAVVIVGSGPLTADLESQIQAKSLGGTVHLIDRVPDVISLMKAADLFVLPSLATVFDVVFMEAMACRLPVLTTRLSGNVEIFGEDCAVLVPPGDVKAISDALAKLLDDASMRDSLAAAARRRLQARFTLAGMLEDYASLYESLSAPTHSTHQAEYQAK
ncbi:MAG: glycosyltransferase family 4 protein [Dehalococcoidia bacterium]